MLAVVMAGLVPAIHVFLAPTPPSPASGGGIKGGGVDARNKCGHDGSWFVCHSLEMNNAPSLT
ncbi:MAG: hypothetical protein DCC74_04690 [Proteobacteria bacterium]|nr:MAG: hypothetical protein DCC74_04690 [Pseudomonadota bacterium]